jgi:hypothetical protein
MAFRTEGQANMLMLFYHGFQIDLRMYSIVIQSQTTALAFESKLGRERLVNHPSTL